MPRKTDQGSQNESGPRNTQYESGSRGTDQGRAVTTTQGPAGRIRAAQFDAGSCKTNQGVLIRLRASQDKSGPRGTHQGPAGRSKAPRDRSGPHSCRKNRSPAGWIRIPKDGARWTNQGHHALAAERLRARRRRAPPILTSLFPCNTHHRVNVKISYSRGHGTPVPPVPPPMRVTQDKSGPRGTEQGHAGRILKVKAPQDGSRPRGTNQGPVRQIMSLRVRSGPRGTDLGPAGRNRAPQDEAGLRNTHRGIAGQDRAPWDEPGSSRRNQGMLCIYTRYGDGVALAMLLRRLQCSHGHCQQVNHISSLLVSSKRVLRRLA